MRKQKPPDPPQDIPFWFITYSDVITLLMTFFILLLTFATSEPEMFERMQISLFGGGGATGIAGPGHGSMELDSVLLRQRPRAGRITSRGSETPPIHEDPTLQSLASGLSAMQDADPQNLEISHAFRSPVSLLVAEDNSVTSLGRQRLRMLARQLRKAHYGISFEVGGDQDVSKAIVLARHLIGQEGVLPGKIGVGVRDRGDSVDRDLKIVLTATRTN